MKIQTTEKKVFYDGARTNSATLENDTTKQHDYIIAAGGCFRVKNAAGEYVSSYIVRLFPTQQDESGDYVKDENNSVICENG